MARPRTRRASPQAPPSHVALARDGGAWWRLLLIVTAGTLIYGHSLAYPLVFDDQASIVTNTSIRDLWSTRVLFPDREVPTAGRPLVNVVHAINYAAGGFEPRGYRAVNLVLHLLCAAMVFLVVRHTLRGPVLRAWTRGRAESLAWAAALLWAVHPLNSEVVEYITQRSESLMAICYLLTIFAAANAIEPGRRRAWGAAAVGACALGMACKESMVTAPVAVCLYDRTFIFGSWSVALRERWRLYLGLAATWLLLAALIWSGPRAYSAGFSTDVTPWSYLMNQAVLIPHYLRLAAWPTNLVVAYGPPSSLTLQTVMPFALVMAIAIAAIVVALKRWPVAGFAGAWVLLTLAPTSSIVPIATEVGAERRMYLPLVAIAVLVAASLSAFADRVATRRSGQFFAIVTLLIAATLGAASYARTREYESPLGLAETVLARRPTAFAHAIVGTQLAIAGRHDDAIAQLRIAAPGYTLGRYHLGGELFNRGDFDAALPELQTFVALDSWRAEAVPARMMIAGVLTAQRRPNEAAEELRRVMTMAPRHSDAYTTAIGMLGDVVFGEQKFADAVRYYREFLAARPGDVNATINLGAALAQSGHAREAADAFRRAIQLSPSNAMARRNLAILLEENPELR